MAGDLPARRIDRDALERIIRRAAELQAGEMDTGEELTETELLKLGAEVGIDGRFLRQALYEESSSAPPEEHGLVARWLGPGSVRASRVVQGDRATLEQALDQWMAEGELLAVKRRLPDRTVFERQKGFVAEMKRGFGVGGRAYQLAKAKDVSVAVSQLESGYCHVELSADVTVHRSSVLGWTVAVGSVGAAGVILTAALAAPLVVPVTAAVFFGTGAALSSRAHRPEVERTQLALDQVLDRLERGEIKPKHQPEGRAAGDDLGARLFHRVAGEIRRAIGEVSENPRRPSRRLPPGP